jgi:hypothetical protein
MMIAWRHRLLHQKEKNMEQIDVHGLPEDEMQLIAAFVEFLRARRQEYRQPTVAAPAEREPVFAAWPLGVKGTLLSRDEIYEHL